MDQSCPVASPGKGRCQSRRAVFLLPLWPVRLLHTEVSVVICLRGTCSIHTVSCPYSPASVSATS